MTPPSKIRVSIFTALYFGGLFFQLGLFITVFFWVITAPLTTHLLGIVIMLIQAAALMSSGMWWLPTCAWISRLPKPKGPHP